MTTQKLQNTIKIAISDVAILGIKDSALKHGLKEKTISRILGLRPEKTFNGKVSVNKWCKDNGIGRFIGDAFLKQNGGDMEKILFNDKYLWVCNNIEYKTVDSNLITIEDKANMLDMSRQHLCYYVREKNIPFVLVGKKRFLDVNLDVMSYIKKKS